MSRDELDKLRVELSGFKKIAGDMEALRDELEQTRQDRLQFELKCQVAEGKADDMETKLREAHDTAAAEQEELEEEIALLKKQSSAHKGKTNAAKKDGVKLTKALQAKEKELVSLAREQKKLCPAWRPNSWVSPVLLLLLSRHFV